MQKFVNGIGYWVSFDDNCLRINHTCIFSTIYRTILIWFEKNKKMVRDIKITEPYFDFLVFFGKK